MSYENAPATKMLASHCAVCARPLVDAVSVETGIGPDCRKKYGFNKEVDAETRAAANALVYEVAREQTGAKAAQAADLLGALGFHNLAERILERVCEIRITVVGESLKVETPYNEVAVQAFRNIPGRRWDPTAKVNFVPVKSKAALWAFLKKFYNGASGIGPKGIFTVGAVDNVAAAEREMQEMEARADREQTARETAHTMSHG